MAAPWEYLLHRIFGGVPEGAAKVKLGAGVVYLTTAAVIAFFVAVGGICWALSNSALIALGVVAILAVVLAVFLVGTWTFADKHPDQAALGGSWWLKYREMQMAAEAKTIEGRVVEPALKSSTDPTRPLPGDTPPQIESEEDK